MRIGIIGAGWLGGTVGSSLVLAGHEVLFSTRHPERLAAMAKELGPRASVGEPRAAAAFGPIVLIATPYAAIPAIASSFAQELAGKIVLDACNPSASQSDPLARESVALGVGRLSMKLLPGARVVRAFSAVDATDIEASRTKSIGKLGVPLASDDKEALEIAAALVRDVGCEPLIVGDMAASVGFQRGGPGFRANTTLPELRRVMGIRG